MIDCKLKSGDSLRVGSNYNSGRHIGFYALTSLPDSYDSKSLDRVLSREQIHGIELLIAATIKSMINGVEQ